MKVILDVDTGTDDAVAIMLAALHPDLELIAVTTVNGNVPLENTTDNTLRTLDFIGRGDIPVYPGLARPLVRHDFPGRKDYGGKSDMHGVHLDIPEPTSKARETGAVEFSSRRSAAPPSRSRSSRPGRCRTSAPPSPSRPTSSTRSTRW